MKKKVFLSSTLLCAIFSLSSCGEVKKEITRSEALSILKQIDREINYTPLANAPKSYISEEKLSSYVDGEKKLKNVTINREIDQNSHYSFVRITGIYKNRNYIHENWTYISNSSNVTCHYYNYVEAASIVNDRYRYETEKNIETWEDIAEADIEEMQRLYAQMAKTFYSYLYGDDEDFEGNYYSSKDGSIEASFSSSTTRYSCVFEDYYFRSGSREAKNGGDMYSSSVSWNRCDISMPSLDFYPLRENVSNK